MKVSFANLEGRWTLRFTGGEPRPGDEFDIPKRSGPPCHKTVGEVLKREGGAVWTSFTPDCGRVPGWRGAVRAAEANKGVKGRSAK